MTDGRILRYNMQVKNLHHPRSRRVAEVRRLLGNTLLPVEEEGIALLKGSAASKEEKPFRSPILGWEVGAALASETAAR